MDKQFCAYFTADDLRLQLLSSKSEKLMVRIVSFWNMCYMQTMPYSLCIWLTYSIYVIHSFVPVSFSSSVIVPVVKDRNGDASKCSNYRPVSLVTMFSKVLELYLFSWLESCLKVDELRFGFVPNKHSQ